MSERRPRPTLLGGRIRTSTAILAALFAAFVALYIVVRPPPETGPSSRAAQEERRERRERRERERTTDTTPAATTPTATTPAATTPPTTPTEPEDRRETTPRTTATEPPETTPQTTATQPPGEEQPPAPGNDGTQPRTTP